MSVELVKGTIEHVPINVKDRLGTLTDLLGTAPMFLIRRESDQSDIVVPWTGADLTAPAGMTAHCLIDTTDADFTQDRYELLLKFNNAPEIPILGPFDFQVI